MELYDKAIRIARDPAPTRWLYPLLIAADACLCALIIVKVPYTEIDWEAYMQQISQYLDGERDYTLIKGGTGPLVYPAAHVYIYSILYKLTDGGKNILLAQAIFAWLYLGILSVVMACYRKAKAPPYIFPLLILSKRLHSIFLLRLFNDCFAVGFLFIAIYAYQHRIWTVGSVAYSFGVGTKMSLLLAGPAVGILLLQALPLRRALNAVFLMAQVQVTIAWPFIPVNPLGYLTRAFELSRVFLYKWTVNWRFLDEKIFLSREFAIALAAANVALLTLFVATRWLKPSRQSITEFPIRHADWHSLCANAPLPILFLHRLVDALLAVEIENAPLGDICGLGSTGVGVECLPKHQCKLGGSGRMFVDPSAGSLVGYSTRRD
ncbi:MAG: hypothetical protein LQ346_001638 [Caloplaca aetnensis]|nr:MAG: hypothetical protein LQ346_001638 [Caloplaca aetnensis]